MSVPVLVDASWWTRGEVVAPDSSTSQRTTQSYLWMVKEGLLNTLAGGTAVGTRTGASVWTVVGSSNGTTAALDGVDRWGATFTPANLVRAPTGNAHSWIVLQNSGLGVWLLLDYIGSADTQCAFSYARNAFTGGSTTTAPTSTTQTAIGTSTIASAITILGETTFSVTYRFGISVNSTGEFHILFNRAGSGYFTSHMLIGTLRSQRVGDQWPTYGAFSQAASGRGVSAPGSLLSSTVLGMRNPTNTARVSSGGLVSGYDFGGASFESSTVNDSIDGRFMALPIFAVSLDAAPNAGYRGVVQDMYITNSAGNVGGFYPPTGPQEYVLANRVLVPFRTPVLL